jgi:hypothetical protein
MMRRDVRKHFVGILTAETRGARDRELAVLVAWEPDHDLRVVVEAIVDVNLHG